jgi:hypothetical protein
MSDRTIGCAHCAYQRTEQDAARWLATREKLAALLDAQKRVIDAARAWCASDLEMFEAWARDGRPSLALADAHRRTSKTLRDALRAIDELEAGE